MVKRVDVKTAWQRLQSSQVVMIDIRAQDERAQGVGDGIWALGRDYLESEVLARYPDKKQPLYLICRSGKRSLYAAEALQAQGYQQVWSVDGGMMAWQEQSLPMAKQDPALALRYDRQRKLPQIGDLGQKRLCSSRVLIIGMGGLGCPVAQYLAGAGVGHLTLVDDDVVAVHNLHRQILYADYQVGQAKVASAKQRLQSYNPDIDINAIQQRVSESLLRELVPSVDVVVECTDQLSNRYVVNQVCAEYAVPWVYGSVDQFSGQVAVFGPWGADKASMCYRCLYPEQPKPGAVGSCSEAGVLGVLPGTIGLMQATETLKILLGLPSLQQQLLVYDALRQDMTLVALKPKKDCAYCQPQA